MTQQMCPTHQLPLKVSQYGGFYCPGKNPDGSYCKFKLKAPLTEQPQPPAQPIQSVANANAYPVASPAAIGQPGADLVPLATASLQFSAKVYDGPHRPADPREFEEKVVSLAMRTFAAMKALVVP